MHGPSSPFAARRMTRARPSTPSALRWRCFLLSLLLLLAGLHLRRRQRVLRLPFSPGRADSEMLHEKAQEEEEEDRERDHWCAASEGSRVARSLLPLPPSRQRRACRCRPCGKLFFLRAAKIHHPSICGKLFFLRAAKIHPSITHVRSAKKILRAPC